MRAIKEMRWRKFMIGVITGWVLHLLITYLAEWLRNIDERSVPSEVTYSYSPQPELFYKQLRNRQSNTYHLERNAFADLMPHLLALEETTLDPMVLADADGIVVRSPAQLIIAIPSVHRTKMDYIQETLRGLFDHLAPEERALVKFVVMLAERNLSDPDSLAFINRTLTSVEENFATEVNDGLLEVILPQSSWYPPDITSVQSTFGDSPERMYWRTKQNLDYAYLMSYVHTYYPHSEYYMQLEDDIISVQHYVSAALRFARSKSNWVMCDFSTLGFIGKLLHRTDLTVFVNAILLLYRELPVDWILDELFRTKYCPMISKKNNCSYRLYAKTIRPLHNPPLFQHNGMYSSLKGKLQKLREKNFVASKVMPLLSFNNPPNVKLDFQLPPPYANNSTATASAVQNFYEKQTPLRFPIDNRDGNYFIDVICERGCEITKIEVLFSYLSSMTERLPEMTPFEVYAFPGSGPCIGGSACNETLANNFREVGTAMSMFRHDFHRVINLNKLRIEFRGLSNVLHNVTFTAMRLFGISDKSKR